MFDMLSLPVSQIMPLRNTTNTLMLECSHIFFNEFSLQESYLIQAIKRLINTRQVPRGLLCIKSKKFKIDFSWGLNQEIPRINYVFQTESSKNEMNSSIYFEIKSIINKEKIYKILVFRKGKINVPGIQTIYQLSEVQNIIQILLRFYTNLT